MQPTCGVGPRSTVTELLDRLLTDEGIPGISTRLGRLNLLVQRHQDECLADFDLSFVEYSLVRVLQLVDPPHEMTPSALAEYISRSTGGVTQIVDRLVAKGFAERHRDRDDRRRMLVRLTPGGEAIGTGAHDRFTRERQRILGASSADDIANIIVALSQLTEMFENSENGNEDLDETM